MAKIVICKHCLSKDVFWEKTPEGRWYLSDAIGGLPHACDQAYNYIQSQNELIKKNKEEQKQRLKQAYYKKKEELAAILDGSQCGICYGSGVVSSSMSFSYYSHYCNNCDKGKVTAKAKARILYKLRRQLWPSMFNKTDRKVSNNEE